jgi:hypothetical protein
MKGENLSILGHSLLRARQRFTGIIAADGVGKGVDRLDHDGCIRENARAVKVTFADIRRTKMGKVRETPSPFDHPGRGNPEGARPGQYDFEP